jgi:hypothetical protein
LSKFVIINNFVIEQERIVSDPDYGAGETCETRVRKIDSKYLFLYTNSLRLKREFVRRDELQETNYIKKIIGYEKKLVVFFYVDGHRSDAIDFM